MKSTGLIRRAIVLSVAGLFLAVSTAGNAAASSSPPASAIALDDKSTSTKRTTARSAAACPEPGQRVKTSTSPSIYLIDPEADLNLIPNPTVYTDVFDTWGGVVVFDNLFTECYLGYYTLTDGHLAKTSTNGAIYIYQAAVEGYRLIVSPAVFDHYNFAWLKVRTQATVSPIVTSLPWS